ncbi:asparaginase [Novosphingobium lindaniclasticum LE124]|jgi:L-asparaginase|uniref:Asparaginase n=2 Tax=Novosphingobium TaxID=165696 RepID=T0HZZ8_9SPHN|nr:asparaginase [Novosphingobium lindaniclasticum LE124]
MAGMENSPALSPILVVTTGGTFDKQYFDALSEYQIAESVIDKLLKIARVAHPVRVVELMRKDSLELTDEDRAAIRTIVASAPETHVVITHGTDTMTETAKVLADLRGRTIVLTGALAPARFAESDAAFNLGMAFACCQSAANGVWITMNGSVFNGLKVRKDRGAGKFVTL